MEGDKVDVKWGKEWFPATIVRCIDEEEVEVEFENPDYPPEIVSVRDIKPVDASSNPPSVRPIAGAFDWQVFKIFAQDIMGDGDFVTALSAQEPTDFDLKTSLLTLHANERKEERYPEAKQEFLRSLNTDQYRAFRETRRIVVSDGVRINCTPDLKKIISVQARKDKRATERIYMYLEKDNIGDLRNAAVEWNRRHAGEAVSLDIESYTDLGESVTTHVITTTTRFVLSEDWSRIVTVIKLDKSFGEWRKDYNRDQKKRAHNKYG